MHTVVGIDIETTSLDKNTGEIIEIAAIRYDVTTQQEIGRFEALSRPQKSLELITTEITGITDAMLEGKPFFADIAAEVKNFIGADLVFAHNAQFDVSWLIHHGVDLTTNKVWDTFPLSGIAWPEAASYNLGALAAMLNVSVESEHRAAADVEVTWQLLLKIREALHLPKSAYRKIIELLDANKLTEYSSLFTLYKANNRQQIEPKKTVSNSSPDKGRLGGVFIRTKPPSSPLRYVPPKPRGEVGSGGSDSIKLVLREIFGATGYLSQHLPPYHYQPQQEEMAATVMNLMTSGGIGLMEAQTGVGKEIAYLVPTLLSAEKSHKVVISTHTKQLQDLLLEHDIPAVQQALGTNRQIANLKSRKMYLCSERLETLLQGKHTLTHVDVFALIKIITWQANGGNGELDRLNFSHQPTTVPQLIHANAISCRNSCSIAKQCPYHVALAAALAADLVIVDHTLLISMQIGSETSLKAHTIIFDEAHHLEEAARSATELDLTLSRIEQITAALDQSFSGTAMYESVHTSLVTILTDYHHLLNLLGTFIGSYSTQNRVLLTKSVRKDTSWRPIAGAGNRLQSQIKRTTGLIIGSSSTADAAHQAIITAALQNLQAFAIELASFLEGNSERISWIELEQQPEDKAPAVILHDVALTIKTALLPLLAESTTVIAISSTLKTSGNFSYAKRQLGLTEAKEFTSTSPFNYQKQLLIYLITDMPGAISATYLKKTSQIIAEVAKLLGGRTLGLFTAKQTVKESYHLISKLLKSDITNESINSSTKPRITLLAQDITGGRANMVRRFRKNPHSVLLGAGAWWANINLLWENARCVILSRLPFTPPTDPIHQASAETGSSNAFTAISVPQMILRTRVAVESLIQSPTDQSAVILLDPRIRNQAYGESLLASLPPATFITGTSHDISTSLEKWFGKEQLTNWQKSTDE